MQSDVATAVPFAFFITLLQRISTLPITKSASKTYPYPALNTLRQWIRELRHTFDPLPSDTAGIILNLLFPEHDIERKFQFKEQTLGLTLSKALAVSTAPGHRGHVLKSWNKETAMGCFGAEVHLILRDTKGESQDATGPTLRQINDLLTELASRCAWSDQSVRSIATLGPHPRSREAILRELYSSLRPLEAAFITQIILKDLRPLLYPLPHTSTAVSLLQYNSKSIVQLTKEDAMRAWDPSHGLLQTFRTNASLSRATTAVVCPDDSPEFGSPVEIPKCDQGRGCKQALARLADCETVWAETKYDGERAQIHVRVSSSGSADIKIVSKSGRDSTLDRYALHPLIKRALGLPSDDDLLKNNPRTDGADVKSVIVEAEMVAFDDVRGCVDEFWRIRSIVDSTAHGIRRHMKRRSKRVDEDSQTSLMSNASDDGTRHLALVFFDVLMVDGEYLLSTPYSARREVLEAIIKPEAGYAMLAARYPIDLTMGLRRSQAELRRIFATHIANFEEGLVLKADRSAYKDPALPWIKLKRDYIPGYGDCIDLAIVGATWGQDRGRELRVAPETVTMFYIGVLANSEALKLDPSIRPHFEVYFTCSYGLSREALEHANFVFKASDHVEYEGVETEKTALPYTFSLGPGLEKPRLMLEKPLLAELYGGGFTKTDGGKYYELRWPRMTKVHRSIERSWEEGATLEKVQQIAHDVVGCDSTDKDVEDIVSALWGKPVKESVRSPTRRRISMLEWLSKMEVADGIHAKAPLTSETPRNVATIGQRDKGISDMVPASGGDEQGPMRIKGGATHVLARPLGSHHLKSMTNIATNAPLTPMATPSPSLASSMGSPRTKRRASVDENNPKEHPSPVASALTTPPQKKRRVDDLATPPTSAPRVGFMTEERRKALAAAFSAPPRPVVHPSPSSSDGGSSSIPTPWPSRRQEARRFNQFLNNCWVWLGQPKDHVRLHNERPTYDVVPSDRHIKDMASFLEKCGWGSTDIDIEADDTAERGVMLVNCGSVRWYETWVDKAAAMKVLQKRSEADDIRPPGERKEIWLIDSWIMNYGELEARRGRYEKLVVAKFQ
ncbi:hypothetical protein FA95DRAFT_1533769 [Auriscalpium vulgare]|uniref:Uncharacterized protein n=1 Tax=Auriscalpium vulgare TaxID=40419 RepID=A0ACB8S6W5_9AGAM|nr:hypothetical protein FA95DRAFT_1533769 [Auriscalpium vulgare]